MLYDGLNKPIESSGSMQYAIFDLDNTILDFDRAEAANLAAVFQHHGVTDIRRAENEYQA